MDDEILQEFLAESWENLAKLDTEIVALEKDPQNEDLISSIFRTIHTIKGTCGFIGLTELGSVAHSAENVLGKMRSADLAITPAAISLVLQAVDVIKELLEELEATGEEPKMDNSSLIKQLDVLAESGVVGDAGIPVSQPEPNVSAPHVVEDVAVEDVAVEDPVDVQPEEAVIAPTEIQPPTDVVTSP